MNWSVDWHTSAEDALTDLWLSASDQAAVTSAANQIDRDLKRDPLGVGESRSGVTRIHLVAPLGVFYDVDQTQRHVTVYSVWRF